MICIKHFLSAEALRKRMIVLGKNTNLLHFPAPSWPNISALVYHMLACCSDLLTSNISYCQATGTGTWDLGLGTWDLGLGTWDLGPGTWDLGPRT